MTRSLFGELDPPPGALEISKLFAESTNPRLEEPRRYTDEELRKIEVPILLPVGDQLRSKESARRLARLQPKAQVELIAGVGHALVGQGSRIAGFLDRA